MMKKIICISLLVLGLSACGLEKYPAGDLPTQARLSSVKKGDSKEKILRILGTPATESVAFQDGSSFVIYAQNMKESRAFFDPEETKRDVYVYYFDAEENLTEQKHLTLADKQDIPYDDTETTVGGKELSIVDQLIQNFGRYNTGAQDSSVRH